MSLLFQIKKTLIGKIVGLVAIIGLTLNAQAQFHSIKLVNEANQKPIKNANFIYGDQQGISSESGEISIQYKPEFALTISHLQFGKQKFSPKEVKLALQRRVLLIKPKIHLLQPVTLLSIHPNAGEREKMAFGGQDKLAHDAGQVLEQFSSISSIRKSGAYGFDPVLRGFKYDQINLVIDGAQSATAGCPNRMDPGSSQVPVNMITQAEIMKGPYSLRYGNAFGGTINFKSKSLHFSEKPKVQGRLSSSYETNGDIIRTEGVTELNSKILDLSFFGALSTGNDYNDGDGITIPANFYRSNVGGKIGIKISQLQQLKFMASHNFAKDVDFPALPMDLRKDDTWLFNLGHKAIFRAGALAKWETTLYTTKVNHLMDNLDKALVPRMVNAQTSAKTYNAGGRSELQFEFNSDHLFVGTDMHIENAKGTRQRDMLMGPMAGKTLYDNVWQDALIRKNGLFAEYHLQRDSYYLVFSSRLELNHAEAQDADSNFAGLYSKLSSDYINPAFSLGGTKNLTENFSLGLWLGTVQRSGSLAERYINFFPIGLDPYELVGNPKLKPETNNQIDLVFNYKTEKTAINIDLFSSFLRNYISSEIRSDWAPRMSTSPGVRQFVNIDKALHTGFEASWQQILSSFLQHKAELAFTYGQNTTNDEPLPEIPPMEFRYRLIGSFIKNKLRAEASFRHAFAQNRIAESYGETKSPAFDVVDLNTSYKIIPALSFSFSIKNVFDEAYYEHLARSIRNTEGRPIYSPGRSFYFSLSYHLM